jgi:hypothetical protein
VFISLPFALGKELVLVGQLELLICDVLNLNLKLKISTDLIDHPSMHLLMQLEKPHKVSEVLSIVTSVCTYQEFLFRSDKHWLYKQKGWQVP